MLQQGVDYYQKKVVLMANNPNGTSLRAGLEGVITTSGKSTSSSIGVLFNGSAPYMITKTYLKLADETIEDVEREMVELRTKLQLAQHKLDYCNAFSVDKVDENKVKVWIALKTIKSNSSEKTKVEIIANLLT